MAKETKNTKQKIKKKTSATNFPFPFLGHGEGQYRKAMNVQAIFKKEPSAAVKKWIEKQLLPDIFFYRWTKNILMFDTDDALAENIYLKYDKEKKFTVEELLYEFSDEDEENDKLYELLYNEENWNAFHAEIDTSLVAIHKKCSISFAIRMPDYEYGFDADSWHTYSLTQIRKQILPAVEKSISYSKNKKVKESSAPRLLYDVLTFFEKEYRSKSFSPKEKEKLMNLIKNSMNIDSYMDSYNFIHFANLLDSFSSKKKHDLLINAPVDILIYFLDFDERNLSLFQKNPKLLDVFTKKLQSLKKYLNPDQLIQFLFDISETIFSTKKRLSFLGIQCIKTIFQIDNTKSSDRINIFLKAGQLLLKVKEGIQLGISYIEKTIQLIYKLPVDQQIEFLFRAGEILLDNKQSQEKGLQYINKGLAIQPYVDSNVYAQFGHNLLSSQVGKYSYEFQYAKIKSGIKCIERAMQLNPESTSRLVSDLAAGLLWIAEGIIYVDGVETEDSIILDQAKPYLSQAQENLIKSEQFIGMYDQTDHRWIDPYILYHNRGRIEYFLKNYDVSIMYYEKAWKLQPDNIFIENMIGCIYNSQKKYDLAEAHFKKMLEKNKNSILAISNLANVAHEQGNLEKAYDLFKKALKINSHDIYSNSQIKIVKQKLKQNGKKIK